MIEIVPAIIPETLEDLREKVSLVREECELVQVDICDGKFTPNVTWPLEDDRGEFNQLVSEADGLPFWEEVNYEFHLMTETHADEVADWVRAGAMRVILHIENGSDVLEDIISEWGHAVEIGIAIKFETPLTSILGFLEKVKSFQLMGISKVGYQGQKFEEGVLGRIKTLRELAPKHIIAVDGGVNLGNAKKIIDAGANRLVVGSAIWETDIPSETIKNFNNL